MSEANCYPRDGFMPDGKLVLQNETWGCLNKYVAEAINIPKSPNADAQAVLAKLHDAAEKLHNNTLQEVNNSANGLYDFGQTANGTFKGLAALMAKSPPPRDSVESLLANLQEAASKQQKAVQNISGGLAIFQSATTGAGQRLSELLAKAKVTTSQANQSVQTNAKKVESLLAAPDLEVAQLETAMSAIQQASTEMEKVQFFGLTFPAEDGVAASAAGATEIGNLAMAWGTLVTQLTHMVTEVKGGANLEDEPCLKPVALAAAAKDWSNVAAQARSFMTDFYRMP